MSYYPMTTTGKAVAAAADAAAIRTAAGLGTIATQDADDVNISGGSASGVAISGGSLTGVDAIFNDEPVTITGDTTLDGTKNVIIANSSSGAITVTLPAATGSGARYDIKRAGGNTVTIAQNGSDTIDNSTDDLSLANAESVTLVDSASTKWTLH